MLAIYLDGESKSGKTAVGRSIKHNLEQQGYTVRLIVAGHFFRFLTKLCLDALPAGSEAVPDEIIQKMLDAPVLYEETPAAKKLNTPAIDAWVSRLGQRGFVQDAANDWREKAAQHALDDGVEVAIFDGRNLRQKLSSWSSKTQTLTVLELIIACRAEVAAARQLGGRVDSAARLRAATEEIEQRRDLDRQRSEAAYIDPANAVPLRPGHANILRAVETAWATETNQPLPIRFDNSDVPLKLGLQTVTNLAEESIRYAKLQG